MESYGMTHIGQRRSVNQDYIFYSDEPVGHLPNLYIVADGMGGHKAGDRASSFAVERFVELAGTQKEDHPFYVMKEVLNKVNQELFELSHEREEYEGMGTTIVAACVAKEELYVMNLGDSRLYFFDGSFIQITKDHSLVEELVRNGQLTKEEARVHPQKNLITRALGVEMEVKPDFFQLDIKEKDAILLCSDGLSNMIEDFEMESILKQTENLSEAVQKLIDTANEYGGLDNIAVVIARKEEKR